MLATGVVGVAEDPWIRWDWISRHLDVIGAALIQHIELTVIAVGLGVLIAVPLGLLAWRRRLFRGPVFSLTGILYTIPSLALFSFLIPFTGFTNGRNFKATNSLATVLLGVNGQAQNVVKALQQLPNVYSAYVTPGEFDVVATIYGSDFSQILTQVMKVAQVKGISTSETLFAIKPNWA